MLLSAYITAAALAAAQEPVTPEQTEQNEIEIIEVRGERNAALTLPNETPVDSGFGDASSMFDSNRAVTAISKALREALAIDDMHDVQKVAPNTYAAAGFGAPSLPTIRGQLGELFQLGMRRQGGNNGLGIPMSFNGVDEIAVVRGMAPVMYGSTQRTGGYLQLQPKRANLNQQQGEVNLSVGSWQQYQGQFDYNSVLNADSSALRISAEVVREDSFYDFTEYESDSLYLAYAHQFNSDVRLDLHAEFYQVDWTDNAGINRPTQALIDDGLYVTGQGRQANGSNVPGAFSLVTPEALVDIPRSRVYTDPEDINNAQTYLIHGLLDWRIATDLDFSQRFYLQHLQREEIAQNSFVEIVDGATTFETRSEFRKAWQDGGVTWFGANLRYNDVLGFSQFTTEADLPVDLLGPIENRRIPLTAAQQARLIELRPGVFVSPGTQYDLNQDGAGDFNLSDTTDSTSYQWGLFAQHNYPISEQWQVELGLRADYYDVTAADPFAQQLTGNQVEDSYSDWLWGKHLSLRYEPSAGQALYVTWQQSDSTSNSLAGGTVLGADQQINPLNFATENENIELGYKWQPLDSNWYLDLVAYNQKRSLRNRDGSNSGIKARGFESQWFYQVEQAWLSLSYSYLDARFDDSAAFQDSRSVYDAFTTDRPDLVAGTGVGAPNFASFPAANVRVQGLPDHTAALATGYRLNDAWQVGADLTFNSDYKLDYLDLVRIRDQFTLNINAIWQLSEQSRVRFDVFNVTDEENWSPVFEGGYFGSTLVFPELPRHVEVSYRYSF